MTKDSSPLYLTKTAKCFNLTKHYMCTLSIPLMRKKKLIVSEYYDRKLKVLQKREMPLLFEGTSRTSSNC